jgi:hypothetical protein
VGDTHLLARATDKAIGSTERAIFEASNIEHIRRWFERFAEVVQRYNIGPSEKWNEDECGILIGMLGSRFFVIVTYTTQSHALEWPAQVTGRPVRCWVVLMPLAIVFHRGLYSNHTQQHAGPRSQGIGR